MPLVIFVIISLFVPYPIQVIMETVSIDSSVLTTTTKPVIALVIKRIVCLNSKY